MDKLTQAREALTEREIEELRMKAFVTNAPDCFDAYFLACSKWFQDRHYRALSDGKAVEPSGCAHNNDHLAWAISRWKAEVENRPLQNVHRRTLDDTWRQVIRRLGGDPDDLLSLPDHDTMLAARATEGGQNDER